MIHYTTLHYATLRYATLRYATLYHAQNNTIHILYQINKPEHNITYINTHGNTMSSYALCSFLNYEGALRPRKLHRCLFACLHVLRLLVLLLLFASLVVSVLVALLLLLSLLSVVVLVT